MAIPMMEEEVEVISKLGDTPGSDDGLSTQQIKEHFDLAAVRIKRFLNNTLIPHMNQLIDVQALLNGILDSTLSKWDKAANAYYTGEAISAVKRTAEAAVPKSGGTMTGNLSVPMPESAAHAVNKDYVDTKKIAKALPAEGWSAGEAPFTQTITVSGLSDAKTLHVFPGYSGDTEADLLLKDACGCIDYAKRTGEAVTFVCLEYKPSTNIPINLEVGV